MTDAYLAHLARLDLARSVWRYRDAAGRDVYVGRRTRRTSYGGSDCRCAADAL
ncbi:MAG: hypothetical protein WKF47_05210 [Geodermatophilaceae bacterium]